MQKSTANKKKRTVVDNSKISTVSHITNMCFFIKGEKKMITNKEFFKYSRIQPAYSGHFMVYLKAIDKVCFTCSYRKAQQIVKLARGQQIRLARRCKKANRKYYVEYCPYGVNLSYNSLNGNAYEFYCFKTKQERTAWLTKHEYNRFNERVAQETTIENVRRARGRYFIIRGNQVFRASEGAFLL